MMWVAGSTACAVKPTFQKLCRTNQESETQSRCKLLPSVSGRRRLVRGRLVPAVLVTALVHDRSCDCLLLFLLFLLLLLRVVDVGPVDCGGGGHVLLRGGGVDRVVRVGAGVEAVPGANEAKQKWCAGL